MKIQDFTLVILAILVFSGCSIFKVSVDNPATPLSSQQLTTRALVRSFTEQASNEIIAAADSIVSQSADEAYYQINAIRWKLSSTLAYTKAGYQTIPESSLSDVWVLSKQWENWMELAADSVFGDYAPLARKTSSGIVHDVEKLARKLKTNQEYAKLHDFVESYADEHPLEAFASTAPQTLHAVLEYLDLPDTAYTSTVGTNAEVLSDFSDRLGRYQSQLNNTIEWQKDRFGIQWEDSGLDEQFLARADTLASMLNKLSIIAEESPEMMGIIAVRMREELAPLVYSMNQTVDSSLVSLSEQRAELEVYLDQQRAKLAQEADEMGQHMIASASDALVKIIRKIIIYVILLIIVMFGVPFALGYAFGRMRLRRKREEI